MLANLINGRFALRALLLFWSDGPEAMIAKSMMRKTKALFERGRYRRRMLWNPACEHLFCKDVLATQDSQIELHAVSKGAVTMCVPVVAVHCARVCYSAISFKH